MPAPEPLGEELVHEIVRRIFHHLDLLEHHLLLARDVLGIERRAQQQIGQYVHCPWKMLVEHLDVVASALLGGKGVQLSPNRIDLLGDILRRAVPCSLEEHVLDKVGDTGPRLGFVPRPAGQPGSKANRTNFGSGIGQQTETVVELLANNHAWRQWHGKSTATTGDLLRNLLSNKELRRNSKLPMIARDGTRLQPTAVCD